MKNITLGQNGIRITDADYADLRTSAIAAHETPALFASVAEIAENTDENEEFQTEDEVSISAYSSPAALWEMKRGLYTPIGNSARSLWSRIKWGVIEDVCERHAIETRKPEGTYVHRTLDMMVSRIDREASEDGGITWSPLIAFNVASTMIDTWRNAIGEWIHPEYVEIQAQHHMAVTGAERCYVVALFGGITPRLFTVERDEDLVAEIEGAVADFWKTVENGIMPGNLDERDARVISRLNAKILPDANIVDMRNDAEFIALIEKKDSLSKKAGNLKKEIDAIKAQITLKMDGISSAIISDTKQFVWVTVKDTPQPATIKKGYTYVGVRKISEKTAGPKLLDAISA